MLRRRKLGRTGLMLSELGIGTAGFWGKSAFPEARAIALLHEAIERGVNFFDTGATYSDGQAERRLGEVLHAHRGKDLVVGTKAGRHVASNGRHYTDFRPAAVRRSVEQSLRNLKLDCVSLLHLHGPPADVITDELLRCLEKLKESGLVRFCGVNAGSDETNRIVIENDVLSTVMLDYNLFRSARKPAISRLVRAGKGVIAATALAQGHYSNKLFKPTRVADLWYLTRAFSKHRASIARGFQFRFVNHYPGWTGAEIAIAYALSNQEVSAAVFGTTNLERLTENLAAAERRLPQEIIDRIDAT